MSKIEESGMKPSTRPTRANAFSRRACFVAIVVATGTLSVPVQAAEKNPQGEMVGPYLGQKPPGKTPTLFAPGIISKAKFSVIRVAFSPDGNECFFSQSSENVQYPWTLQYAKRVGNRWTPPAVVTFSSTDGFAGQPVYSADGNRLYFTYSKETGAGHIWTVARTARGWGKPEMLRSPVNSAGGNVYYSRTLDGTEYFASDRPGGSGKLDVWRTRRIAGKPVEAENLGTVINTSDYDYDPLIDPHGRYLLVATHSGDKYGVFVSYSDGKGGWNTPIDMDTIIPGFNTGTADGVSFSPDGKYLFWRRRDNGQHAIYWVENPLPDWQPPGQRK